jgi:hypothetical protein
MRGGTGLDVAQARCQRLEEPDDVAAFQLATDSNLSAGVDAMDLEPGLGEIKTNGGNLRGGRLLSCVAFSDDHSLAHDAGERGPSTPSRNLQQGKAISATDFAAPSIAAQASSTRAEARAAPALSAMATPRASATSPRGCVAGLRLVPLQPTERRATGATAPLDGFRPRWIALHVVVKRRPTDT